MELQESLAASRNALEDRSAQTLHVRIRTKRANEANAASMMHQQQRDGGPRSNSQPELWSTLPEAGHGVDARSIMQFELTSRQYKRYNCSSFRRSRSSGFAVRHLEGNRWLKCATERSEKIARALEPRCRELIARDGSWPPNSIDAEVAAYTRLAGLGVTPPLLGVVENGVVLGHAGTRLSARNLPADAMEQAMALITAMRRTNTSHNDLKREDIFVAPGGRLQLVDFGYATVSFEAHVMRREAGCGGSSMWHHGDDEHGIRSALEDTRRGLTAIANVGNMWACPETDPMPMGRGRRPSELHTVVVWNASQLALARQFTEGQIARASSEGGRALRSLQLISARELRLPASARLAMCKAMYVSKRDVAWHKGCAPFGETIGLILINDTAPVYGWRSSIRASQNLNVHMKALKDGLRAKLHAELPHITDARLIHSSVNVEEALLVLRDADLASLVLDSRPSFPTFGALFEKLDAFAPFKYVVYRSTLDVERAEAARGLGLYRRGHKDVDVLVNDFYFFKALTGAQSTDRSKMREQNSGGHIQSSILIGGREVAFDVRYVGDGYVDATWASDVLKRRVRHVFRRIDGTTASFHVPRADDFFFLLLYHCLLQKATPMNLAEKVKDYFAPLSTSAGITPPPTYSEVRGKVSRLWDALETFLGSHRYTLACPSDPSVRLLPWRPNASTQIATAPLKHRCVGGRCGPAAEMLAYLADTRKAARPCIRNKLKLARDGSSIRPSFCWRGSTYYCPTDEDVQFRHHKARCASLTAD